MTGGVSARCYPSEPEFRGDGGPAERRVWEALRDQLPAEAVLFHSLALTEDGRDLDADLVVGWPEVGVAIVEVKAGHITREQGQWYQGGQGRRRPIHPVLQARDCMYVLRRYLRERAPDLAQARFVYLVAFPFTAVAANWRPPPDCPRGRVLARNDLGLAADRIRAAVDRYGKGSRPLTDVDQLVKVLAGELRGQISVLSQAAEHDARVEQMTHDQFHILGLLREHRRIKIVGGAGTGKTWLAIEQTRRLAAKGERVALVCYSRGLAHFLARTTATWPAERRPAHVGLFHDLPLRWGAEPPPPDSTVFGGQGDYYDRRLPDELCRIAARLPAEEKFDSIVVDEAQDLAQPWWSALLACLRDPERGGLYVFLDEAQRVFNRYGEVPIPLDPIVLDENIRNTKRIAQTFGSLTAEQLVKRGQPGPPVRFVPCSTDDALATADREVERLKSEGWPPEQIALLATGRHHPRQDSEVDLVGRSSYWDHFFAEQDVFYGHVLSFKGLERPAVVLAVNGVRDPDRGREYLYVGLSRARTQLVVCGDLHLVGEIGGEAVRIRLERASLE
jgi:hypothetical protein